jgi:hypothetical protein
MRYYVPRTEKWARKEYLKRHWFILKVFSHFIAIELRSLRREFLKLYNILSYYKKY